MAQTVRSWRQRQSLSSSLITSWLIVNGCTLTRLWIAYCVPRRASERNRQFLSRLQESRRLLRAVRFPAFGIQSCHGWEKRGNESDLRGKRFAGRELYDGRS